MWQTRTDSRRGSRPWKLACIPVLVTVVLAACAPAPTASRPAAPEAPKAVAPEQSNRTLNLIMRVEPGGMVEGAVDRAAVHKPLFTATLAAWDLQENPFPILAEAVPTLNTDSWRVFPDGRMETVFRLREGLTWHDGMPLTAEDVAFSRRAAVARVERGLEQTSAEVRALEDIVAPDPRTVIIRWREPFWGAAAPELVVFPRHLLEAAVNQSENREAFDGHPYWSTGWIGAGPYRLDRWERGAFIEGSV